MKKLINFILNFPIIKQLVDLSKKYSLPGFKKIPVHNVIEFFITETRKENLNIRAGFISFNFLLALFPAIIFFFSLMPFVPVSNFRFYLFEVLLKSSIPDSAFDYIGSVIEETVYEGTMGLSRLFFIVLTLFFASNGIVAIMNAFDKDYSSFSKRDFFHKRITALGLMVVIFILLVASGVALFGGEWLIYKIKALLNVKSDLFWYSFSVLKYLVIFFLFLFTFSFILRYAPSKLSRDRFLSPGAYLAASLSIITTLIFAYYVNNFGNYNKIYGSIGALIVVMILLYINSLALLIGFELNTSISENELKNEMDSLIKN